MDKEKIDKEYWRYKTLLKKKYRDLTTDIEILRSRTSNDDPDYNRLYRIENFLKQVREQGMAYILWEEKTARYEELLEYIGETYDGSKESVMEIFNTLDKRDDIDKVLKSDKKRNETKHDTIYEAWIRR